MTAAARGGTPGPRMCEPGRALVALVLAAASAVPLLALGASVVELRAASTAIRATLAVKEVFDSRSRKLLEGGGALHLRVGAELWEDRAAWDRLVAPSIVATFRLARDPATGVLAVVDPSGGAVTYPAYPDPLNVLVDVGSTDRIDRGSRYYLHAIVTVGTLAERDIENVGEAVFGSEESAGGVRAVGRFLVRKILQISDYLQSTSTETTSRKLSGAEIIDGRR